jgi:hypothetical protein
MQLAVDILGWAGAAAVLWAYAFLSANRWGYRSIAYQVLNLAGSAFLVLNTAYNHAYPSTFLNLIWFGIAAYALARFRKR